MRPQRDLEIAISRRDTAPMLTPPRAAVANPTPTFHPTDSPAPPASVSAPAVTTTANPIVFSVPPGTLTYDSHAEWTISKEIALGLVWPLLWLIVFLVIAKNHRPAIDDFIRGITKAGPIERAQPQSAVTGAPKEPPVSADVTVALSGYEAKTGAGVIESHQETASPEPPTRPASGEQTEIERWRLAWRFERIAGEMYESQHAFLKELAAHGPKDFGDAVTWFTVYQYDPSVDALTTLKKGTLGPRAFLKWISFLVDSGLVEDEETGEVSIYKITDLGVGFLAYMREQPRSLRSG